MREISVYVPALSEYYSFNLDENIPLGILADEVASMLNQHDRSAEMKPAQDMIFYSKDLGRILEADKSLSELGIMTGAVLSVI